MSTSRRPRNTDVNSSHAGEERVAFRIAYDGSGYYGYQRQPDVETVERTILDAFDALGVDALTADYAAAGRTDAGVSAVAQTIAVTVPDWLRSPALTAELPRDVCAWADATVPVDFHPRYDAIERRYQYYLTGVSNFDMDTARSVANRLIGTHDFVNLSAANEDTRRPITKLQLDWESPEVVCLTVTAPGFLHQQVRRIASLIRMIATGQRSIDFLDRVLTHDPPLPGHDGIPPAHSAGLVLTDVVYEDVDFVVTRPDRAIERFRSQANRERAHVASLETMLDTITTTNDQQS